LGHPERVWLVTGSSSGFGRELVEAALERGERVVATARNVDGLAPLVEAHPGRLRVAVLDVTSEHNAGFVVKTAVETFGRVDVLVNNAGCGLIGAFEECAPEQVRRNFEVNFFGALSLTRAVLPALRGQRSGTIVNMSAAAAISNYAGFSAYGAAKFALEGWSEAIRAELAPLGVRVVLVEPGPFRTEFIGKSLDRASGKIADYDQTSGRFAALLSKMNGKQPGDPARAAGAIIAAVDSPNPPMRLVLGKYAVEKMKKKLASTGAELAAWEAVGAGTDFA
jgi:NAD(P)-dependent dehydrogenase (short-subunit alcohol dehydrogenase family)